MWYAVHVVAVFESGEPSRIIAEESVVLMEAESPSHILENESVLREMYAKGPSYLKGDKRPSDILIRKVIAISNEDGVNDRPPAHLSELTYELYEFDERERLSEFIAGRSINAKLDDAIKRDR